MLSCRDIAKQASDHIDKKLTLRQSLGYGFHLLLCGYCRKFVGHLRTTIELSHQLSGQDHLSDEEAASIATKALEQAKSE
tara:strand:+ start:1091 stop:1330 length:240 start_codon:yes stop_codon:yes gene_type:complete